MTKIGMILFFTRNRTAHLFLGTLFLWSLLPLQLANGGCDLGRTEQGEFYAQASVCSLPAVSDHRGKYSADQQLHAFARTPRDAFEAFERTQSAERATVIRAFTSLPAHVICAQHTSSDL
jgi:hypothetical protein